MVPAICKVKNGAIKQLNIKHMKNHIVKRILGTATLMTLLAAITQTASARTSFVPDAGSTSILVGIACVGLAAVRRFKR
jgi:hypothetical protein